MKITLSQLAVFIGIAEGNSYFYNDEIQILIDFGFISEYNKITEKGEKYLRQIINLSATF